VTFSPDGNKLAAGLPDVWIWDYPSLKQRLVVESGVFVPNKTDIYFAPPIAFARDGSSVIMPGDLGETIGFWSTFTGKQTGKLGKEDVLFGDLVLNVNGRAAAARSVDGSLRVWDLAARSERAVLYPEPRRVIERHALTFDGKTVASVEWEPSIAELTIRLWDVAGLRRREAKLRSWIKNPPDFGPREVTEMRNRIAALSTIQDTGSLLSPSADEDEFAPLMGSAAKGLFPLVFYQKPPDRALIELIELGPRAIPFLLQALEDKTPTKAKIKKIQYVIRVGDVCYMALSQITGEIAGIYGSFAGSWGVASTIEHPEFIRRIRGTWGSADSNSQLYRAWLRPYNSRPQLRFENDEEFWHGSRGQTEAVKRLLYYFPKKIAPLVANRLAGLDVRDTNRDHKSWWKREVANGLHTEDFIRAVAWSKEPAVRAALFDVFKRTTDSQILLATLPALGPEHAQVLRDRLLPLLDRLPASEDTATGEGYKILVALGRCAGSRAKPFFARYLRNASLQRSWTMCLVLRETRGEWGIEFLRKLLTNTRDGYGGWYRVQPEDDWPTLKVRLCDEAARTLSDHDPRLRFTLRGKYLDLDRQIEAIRQQLAKKRR
jgi:hypothetical protein